MKAKGEQYLSQLQAVDQASEKFTQTASMQDSAGKSLSLPYQDLATRLNKSGALPDINSVNNKLESNMSDKDKANRSENVQYEINRSSASGLVGGDRDALAGFLKLNQQDPVKAAEILNSAIMPTSSGSGVNISPTEFKKDSQSVDGIVSNETAAGFRSKAKGEDSDHDTGGGVEGGNGSGSPIKQSVPQMATHQEHGQKPSADHGALKSSQATGGKPVTPASTAGSQRSKVDAALKNANLGNADKFRSHIESGGKLDGNKDMSGMMGSAMKNEGHVAYDNTIKPVVNTAKSAINSANKAIESVESFAKNALGDGDNKPKQ